MTLATDSNDLLAPEMTRVVQLEQHRFVRVFLADGVHDEAAARRKLVEGAEDGRPDRRGVDHRRQGLRTPLRRVASPRRATLAGERPFVGAAREDVDRRARVQRAGQRQHEMAGGAKASESQRLAVRELREIEGSEADRARAEERRDLLVRHCCRQPVHEGHWRDHPLRVSTVGVPAGGLELRAQVLAARSTETAEAARAEDPGDAHARPSPARVHLWPKLVDLADDLVAQDPGHLRRGRSSLDLVQLGVAHAAGAHPKAHVPVPGVRVGAFDGAERCVPSTYRPRLFQDDGLHPASLLIAFVSYPTWARGQAWAARRAQFGKRSREK